MNIKLWDHTLNDILKLIQGMLGEENIRNEFKKRKIPHFQVDLIFYHNEKYKLAEIKRQEPFEPPPFMGHGLPIWQIDDRLRFYAQTGVEPWLFIIDPINKEIYYQILEQLNCQEYFNTQGMKPRRIFPLDNFRILSRDSL